MIPGEGCEDVADIVDADQAEGILVIHRRCGVECKRKAAAASFLRPVGTSPVARVS